MRTRKHENHNSIYNPCNDYNIISNISHPIHYSKLDLLLEVSRLDASMYSHKGIKNQYRQLIASKESNLFYINKIAIYKGTCKDIQKALVLSEEYLIYIKTLLDNHIINFTDTWYKTTIVASVNLLLDIVHINL